MSKLTLKQRPEKKKCRNDLSTLFPPKFVNGVFSPYLLRKLFSPNFLFLP